MYKRYIVSQALNTWVVRDTEQLKRKKRSVVYECTTKEDAESVCKLCNSGQAVPPSDRYEYVANRG